MLSTETIGVGTQAAIVGVVLFLALPRLLTHLLAVEGVAASAAHHQSLQQILRSSLCLTGMRPVLLQLFADRREHLGGYQRRNRNIDPLLGSPILGRVGPTRRQTAIALCA